MTTAASPRATDGEGERQSRSPDALTAEQMKSRLGEKPSAKVQMILLDDVLYRPSDGGWEAYE